MRTLILVVAVLSGILAAWVLQEEPKKALASVTTILVVAIITCTVQDIYANGNAPEQTTVTTTITTTSES